MNPQKNITMKKLITSLLICSAFFLLSSGVQAQQKSIKQIVKGCKPNLPPYKYDSYALNKIDFSANSYKIDVEFTAFAGIQYKIVFCTSGFEEKVKLNIYDKHKRFKSRKKVYDNESGIDNLFWSFEPSKPGTYYFEYEVPVAADGKSKSGYMVMLIGYQ